MNIWMSARFVAKRHRNPPATPSVRNRDQWDVWRARVAALRSCPRAPLSPKIWAALWAIGSLVSEGVLEPTTEQIIARARRWFTISVSTVERARARGVEIGLLWVRPIYILGSVNNGPVLPRRAGTRYALLLPARPRIMPPPYRSRSRERARPLFGLQRAAARESPPIDRLSSYQPPLDDSFGIAAAIAGVMAPASPRERAEKEALEREKDERRRVRNEQAEAGLPASWKGSGHSWRD